MHTLLKTARPATKRLTHVPIEILSNQSRHPSSINTRPRVMDVGCGTGLWMLQMAEEFPDAIYTGYDINHILPETLMDNIVPHVPFYIEAPWNLPCHDFIHVQLMLGSIINWKYLFANILRNLAPGGWFENVEIDWQPRCDDGTLSTDPTRPGLAYWWSQVSRDYQNANHPLEYNQNIDADLGELGFKEIRHDKYMVPLCGWHTTDPTLHRVGSWWNIAMSQGAPDEGCFGLEAMSMRPITEYEDKWSAELVRSLCSDALKEASDIRVHAYNVLHVVTARAPREGES